MNDAPSPRQVTFFVSTGRCATQWFADKLAIHYGDLAVVAPGLAEALFATALGLLAAIPAVIFYNKFAHDIGKLGARLENFADEFGAIISRQLDERV